MKNTPIDYQTVKDEIQKTGLPVVGNGTIREIVKLVNNIQKRTGEKFIRMEMGVPGLKPNPIGVEAEIAALQKGVASIYPMMEGVAELKEEMARFVKLFMDIKVDPIGCIPTVGAMEAALACFLVANRTDHRKEGTLFIDPGFPVQKQQVRVLGQDYESFDIYNYRGEKLRDKLESYLKTGKISTLLYSSPNNPSWVCLRDDELQIIGELATKYDVIVIEDLAYFGMDFRRDYSKPGQPPYQPTVAKYTDNWVVLFSSSKVFSYAGQRIGCMIIGDKQFNRVYPDLKRYYTSDGFGYSMIYGALYALSAGVSHSAQVGLAAMLKAANDGEYNFLADVKEYGKRAKIMRNLFTNNGFEIVYDTDIDEPVGNGFYFTFSYPGFSGAELVEELIYYGISSIALNITGSSREEGVRACVSQISLDQMPLLEERLIKFNKDHS